MVGHTQEWTVCYSLTRHLFDVFAAVSQLFIVRIEKTRSRYRDGDGAAASRSNSSSTHTGWRSRQSRSGWLVGSSQLVLLTENELEIVPEKRGMRSLLVALGLVSQPPLKRLFVPPVGQSQLVPLRSYSF